MLAQRGWPGSHGDDGLGGRDEVGSSRTPGTSRDCGTRLGTTSEMSVTCSWPARSGRVRCSPKHGPVGTGPLFAFPAVRLLALCIGGVALGLRSAARSTRPTPSPTLAAAKKAARQPRTARERRRWAPRPRQPRPEGPRVRLRRARSSYEGDREAVGGGAGRRGGLDSSTGPRLGLAGGLHGGTATGASGCARRSYRAAGGAARENYEFETRCQRRFRPGAHGHGSTCWGRRADVGAHGQLLGSGQRPTRPSSLSGRAAGAHDAPATVRCNAHPPARARRVVFAGPCAGRNVSNSGGGRTKEKAAPSRRASTTRRANGPRARARLPGRGDGPAVRHRCGPRRSVRARRRNSAVWTPIRATGSSPRCTCSRRVIDITRRSQARGLGHSALGREPIWFADPRRRPCPASKKSPTPGARAAGAAGGLPPRHRRAAR